MDPGRLNKAAETRKARYGKLLLSVNNTLGSPLHMAVLSCVPSTVAAVLQHLSCSSWPEPAPTRHGSGELYEQYKECRHAARTQVLHQSDVQGNHAMHLAACGRAAAGSRQLQCSMSGQMQAVMDIVGQLRLAGCSCLIPNLSGEHPLHLSALAGMSDVCQRLTRNMSDAVDQADVSAVDQLGQTPLHKAAVRGHLHCVQLLLKLRAQAIAQDKDGYTVLHLVGGAQEKGKSSLRAG